MKKIQEYKNYINIIDSIHNQKIKPVNQEILTQKINAVFDDVIYNAAYKFYNRVSFRLTKLEFNIQKQEFKNENSYRF
jgi:hypothetical protein